MTSLKFLVELGQTKYATNWQVILYVFHQVHHESAQLVSVSANLVNKVMADNPQLVK